MPLFKSKAAPPLTKKDISAPFNPTSFDKDVTKSWLRIPQSNKTILGQNGAEVICSRADLFDPEDVMTSAPRPAYSDLPSETKPKPPQRRTSQACPKTYEPDEFYQMDNVVSLNKDNIKDYIQSQETLMITFYDPCHGVCLRSRQKLRKMIEHSDDMSFGAVNCGKNFHLCQAENALKVPFHKMYTRGYHINSLQFFEMFDLMFPKKKRVKTLPTIQQTRKPSCGSIKPTNNSKPPEMFYTKL